MQNEENDKSFDDVEHFKLFLAGQSQTRTTSTGDAHMMIRSVMVNGVIPFVINLFIINIITFC